jgi:hypothetical protein
MKATIAQPKLVPLCRPLFDFVSQARLQVDAGSGEFASFTAEQLADRVDHELEQIRQRKNAAPELAALIRDEDPILEDLRAFATWILASGRTDTSKAINMIRKRRGPVQDEAFTEHLRAELRSVNPSTVERLVIYGVCLGLGYQGVEEEQTVRRLRSDIWGHIQRLVPSPRAEHERSPGCKPLFSEAYDIRTDKLNTAPVRWWTVYAASIVAVVAIVVAVVQVVGVGSEVNAALEAIEGGTKDMVPADAPAAGPDAAAKATAPAATAGATQGQTQGQTQDQPQSK